MTLLDPIIGTLNSGVLRPYVPASQELTITALHEMEFDMESWLRVTEILASFGKETLAPLFAAMPKLKAVRFRAHVEEDKNESVPAFLRSLCDACACTYPDIDIHVRLETLPQALLHRIDPNTMLYTCVRGLRGDSIVGDRDG